MVHVAGAVREPGVYRLPEGSRVTDAIERAGGATGDADANAINLAARLADGQQIQLPARSQAPVGVGGSQAGVGETDGPISLGSATVEQLDSIEGIGPVTAAAILQFRDERRRCVVRRRARRDQRHRSSDDGGPAGAPAAVTARIGVAWRYAALAGLAAGLAIAPVAAHAPVDPPLLLALACLLVIARPRGEGVALWLVLIVGVALLAGLTLGDARLAAIDAGALTPDDGERLRARGTVASTPRVANGVTGFVLEVDGRRVAVESRASLSGVDEGRVVVVHGTARPPAPWLAGTLARDGAAMVVDADAVRATDAVRGGLRGALDGVRRRAEASLERGTPEASAALLRGFVLGQDDRIPESVRDEFRRSGLAHVLAVSGQNVMLLALLATPILGLTGTSLRLRLVCLMALIAIYVPVAGAGPSIQRAGVMGAAGLVAALAGRPGARWYALLLAAVATLALDPRSTGDIGWQLSFAAVAGLLVLVAPLVRVLGGGYRTLARRALAEGAAMTLAATLATAPLAAHHFGTVSLTAIPANLVALPAIAPAMWLGMLAGAMGQIPGAPVEPLTSLGGLCAAFIGWTARAFGGDWAQIEFAEPALGTAIALTAALLLGARLACAALERRSELRPGWGGRFGSRRTAAAALATALATALVVVLPGEPRPAGPPPDLTMRVLDVGQGDAILLEPRDALPILVDTGPPGGGAAERLDDLGIDRLGALALTHDELDHSARSGRGAGSGRGRAHRPRPARPPAVLRERRLS